jgi:hypothetical protein
VGEQREAQLLGRVADGTAGARVAGRVHGHGWTEGDAHGARSFGTLAPLGRRAPVPVTAIGTTGAPLRSAR